jgi:cytochrome c556
MNRLLTLLTTFISVSFFILSISPPTLADAQTASKNRHLLMKVLGANMKKLKQATDATSMVAAAKIINDTSKRLDNDDLWPQGSGGEKSRAKIEIWQDMAGFKAKFKELENASAKLIEISMTDDLSASKKAFSAVGRTCGSCHKVFRNKGSTRH